MSPLLTLKSVRVALVGGDGRVDLPGVPAAVTLDRYSSRRHAGNGELRRLVAAVRAGNIDFVLVLVRWIGHAASDRLLAVCRAQGVPFLLIPGGGSAAIRALSSMLGGVA